eukprot:TRINITY_DN1060_c3_g1_i1.p1 TRINITY_DN1060_c3_g1~~TRINITY_DN1060_c3_g1_i1.p1  ORF type:complete len:633 (+),score=266.33 TRINITY_DN1060_c3_g1_i1:123-1901(+)
MRIARAGAVRAVPLARRLTPQGLGAPLQRASFVTASTDFGAARRLRTVTQRRRYATRTMNMADVGEGIKEVEITGWAVKEGDTVEEFQKLCDVQSDKASVEVSSPFAGKVTKLYTAEGDKQQVGQPLVDFDVAADGGDEPAAAAPAAPPAAAPAKKAAAGPRVHTMTMQEVGDGINSVEISEWVVAEGDTVTEGQKVCEAQSDKASMELHAAVSGKVLKLHTAQGSKQAVGEPLMDIETTDGVAAEVEEEAPAAAAPAASAAAPAAAASSGSGFQQTDAGRKVLTSPKVRRLAREQGIDLAAVKGTGTAGRVTAEDFENYVKNRSAAPKPAAAAPAASAAPAGKAPTADTYAGAPVWSPEDRTVKITGITKRMVETMTASLSIPTFNASDEVNLNALVEARAALKPIAEKRGARLSFMPFFIKAASLALKEFPVVNSTLNKEVTEVIYKGAHNIGVAMDTPQGLIVPNIKDVQSKSILQIAKDLNGLQERGAAGKLTTGDLQGGTFTLSNIGPIGATYVSPIIFPPQVAIGALGKTAKLPRFDEKGNVYAANILYVTWTADHRVIDGATMVRYSNLWKQYLEHPSSMLLETA